MNKKAAAATLAIITLPIIYIGLMIRFGGEVVIGLTVVGFLALLVLGLIIGGTNALYQHFKDVFPE